MIRRVKSGRVFIMGIGYRFDRMYDMNSTTSFTVVAVSMGNRGANAKSHGVIFDTLEDAIKRANDAFWTPLCHGREWSKAFTVMRRSEMGRKTVYERSID